MGRREIERAERLALDSGRVPSIPRASRTGVRVANGPAALETRPCPPTRPVRKAVIPAAGLGTRFLPATKAQPKEMLPVVDKPAIQYVVEEAVRAGIDDILIITGRGKRSIEDHFDRNFELEYFLQQKGKHDDFEEIVGHRRARGHPLRASGRAARARPRRVGGPQARRRQPVRGDARRRVHGAGLGPARGHDRHLRRARTHR